VKEHGTLFKPEMVRALLRQSDPKSQTRRLFTRHNSRVDGARASPALWADLNFDEAWVDNGPSPAGNPGPYLKVPRRSDSETVHRVYATIEPGDRLWVRETHCDARGGMAGRVLFRADGDVACKWTPGIHMPRVLSRILLEVLEVRIQRLQQINESDSKAEGCAPAWLDADDGVTVHAQAQPTYRRGYARLWREIHGDASWEGNPWVRAFVFRGLKP
jgi:hypothetical protein